MTHNVLDVRCDMRDAAMAIDTGVDGLDVVIGTSQILRQHSHGKDMAYITKTALEVIQFIKSKGLEVRCSSTVSLFEAQLITKKSLARIHSGRTWWSYCLCMMR